MRDRICSTRRALGIIMDNSPLEDDILSIRTLIFGDHVRYVRCDMAAHHTYIQIRERPRVCGPLQSQMTVDVPPAILEQIDKRKIRWRSHWNREGRRIIPQDIDFAVNLRLPHYALDHPTCDKRTITAEQIVLWCLDSNGWVEPVWMRTANMQPGHLMNTPFKNSRRSLTDCVWVLKPTIRINASEGCQSPPDPTDTRLMMLSGHWRQHTGLDPEYYGQQTYRNYSTIRIKARYDVASRWSRSPLSKAPWCLDL